MNALLHGPTTTNIADKARRLRMMMGIAVVVVLFPISAFADEKVIYLGTAQQNDPANETVAVMGAVFKSRVEAASGHTLRVEIFPDSQLGGNRELAALVQKNTIQSAIVTVGGIAPYYPPIAVIEMPFAYESAETAHTVLDGPFGGKLKKNIAAGTGMTVLGFGDPGGFFVLTNSKREIRSPRDLEGIRIRSVPGFEVMDSIIVGMGGTPVKVSSRDEYLALHDHLIDGEMDAVPVVVSHRYDDVQKYMTLINHVYAPSVWVLNTAFMESLTPEQGQAVTEAAKAAILAGRDLSRRIEISDHGLPALRGRMQIYQLSAEERAVFKATAQPKVAAAIAATMGEKGSTLLKAFLTAIDQAAGGSATHRKE